MAAKLVVKKLGRHKLIHGDCVTHMRSMPPDSIDVVLTDPPYCSAIGGQSPSRSCTTQKYTSTDAKRTFSPFSGDHRDQRSFTIWCAIWMTEAYRLTRDGGAIVCFIDYRNLACVIDAVQAGGWSYDGVIPWVKTNGRPRLGWFQTSKSEFAVVARKGRACKTERKCGPKAVHASFPKNRVHPTQKPVEVLSELIEFRSDWQRILDPFSGAATTVIAAEHLGRTATAIELNDDYYSIGCKRVSESLVSAK